MQADSISPEQAEAAATGFRQGRRANGRVLSDIRHTIARDDSQIVRSYRSNDPEVQAICHHSGQYLTAAEANHPVWNRLLTRLLREQHDFPGLRNLDRAFRQAVHAAEHQHIVWSRVAIQSIALLVLGPLVLLLTAALFRLQDVVPLAYWYPYLAGLALFAAFGGLMIAFGLTRYARRESLFHRRAGRMPPAIPDYPVQGRFHIAARETVTIDLDNVQRYHSLVDNQAGSVAVTLTPRQGRWEDYQRYRRQYAGHQAGGYLHGGAVALENLQFVRFLDGMPEYDHRLVLRASAESIDPDIPGLRLPAMTIRTHYQLLPDALYPPHLGLPRFPLEIEPRLARNDSRSLELRFHWRSADPAPVCRLEECVLNVPDALGKVTRVTFGRYDQERQQIVWRNRSFRERDLWLQVTFEQPILKCQEMLTGSYAFSYEGLLSGMEIRPEHVWTVLGRPVAPDDCEITLHTGVTGKLTVSLQRLSQEHEHVRSMTTIVCDLPPDEKLVECVNNVLLEEGFDLQRIMRAAPRLDPTGRLDKQLYYWDVSGRRYNEELLDSLDVHVVVTGYDRVLDTGATVDSFQPRANIDLRVRCLSDPRNRVTPDAIDTLLGGEDGYSLAGKIKAALQRQLGGHCS